MKVNSIFLKVYPVVKLNRDRQKRKFQEIVIKAQKLREREAQEN